MYRITRGALNSSAAAKAHTYHAKTRREIRRDHRATGKITVLPTRKPTNPDRENVRYNEIVPAAKTAPNKIRSRMRGAISR